MLTFFVCAGVIQPGSYHCLPSAVSAAPQPARQCSLGCECESAVVPAAALPTALNTGGSWLIGHFAEPAERLGPPARQARATAGAWSTTANAAADVIT